MFLWARFAVQPAWVTLSTQPQQLQGPLVDLGTAFLGLVNQLIRFTSAGDGSEYREETFRESFIATLRFF